MRIESIDEAAEFEITTEPYGFLRDCPTDMVDEVAAMAEAESEIRRRQVNGRKQ